MDIISLYKFMDDYFYGIDLENGRVDSFKRFNNENKQMLVAYNESEKLDTYSLIKSLFIEKYIVNSSLTKDKREENISRVYNEFKNRCGLCYAIFTNDLLKKIGRSIDVEKAAKIFKIFNSVGDALTYIYKVCLDEFKEVSMESNVIDEKELKKSLLHEYKKVVEANFEPRSDEYDVAFRQYSEMFTLINNSSLEEFVDIFKRAYYELLRDVEKKSKTK